MKKNYSILLVVVLSILSLSVNAQISEEESGEFLNEEGYLKDLENKILPKCCSGESVPNLTFFYNPFSASTNHDRIELARERGLNEWFDQQYENFKTEIENQLNKTFPDFEQARNTYYKHWERNNLLGKVGGVKNIYDSKVNVGRGIRHGSIRDLKLLELRGFELNQGNIDNTSYGSFSINGTYVGDIRSLSQLNILRNQGMNIFSNNEVLLHNNSGVSQFLLVDIINGMGNYINNYDYDILNELLQFQINHFNFFGSWQQLDLIQLYLNRVRIPYSMVVEIRVRDYGTASFLENYAVEHRRGGVSIWDDDYYDSLVEAMTQGAGGDERAIEAAEYAAELQVEAERQYALDNLLGSVNVDDLTVTNFNTNSLTDAQKVQFNDANSELLNNCLGTALLNAVNEANVTMGATQGPGEYNPVTNTISFRTNNDINSTTLGAELMHAYQQQLYGTLSDIYNGTTNIGGSNIEFEEKAFNIMFDMMANEIAGDAGISINLISYNTETEMLYNWLIDLQINHPTGPIILSSDELASWYEALEQFQQFHQGNSDHYGDPIDINQNPDAILNLINNVLESDCN